MQINDDARGTYNANRQIKLKTLMLKPSLCDYSDAYILVKETTSIKKQTEGNPINDNKKSSI